MFDFGKNGENLKEEKVKKYFKENNFFGLQSYTVNFEAKELKILQCMSRIQNQFIYFYFGN